MAKDIFMDKIKEKMKNTEEAEFPKTLHGRIIRKVFFLRYRASFAIAFSILFLNLFISVWQIWVRLAETEIIITLKALFDGFEMSLDFAADFWNTVASYLPLRAFIIFILNLCLIGYTLYFYAQAKKYKLLKVD